MKNIILVLALVLGSAAQADMKKAKMQTPVKIDIVGVYDSDINPANGVLAVNACGLSFEFAFPKSMLANKKAVEAWLVGTVMKQIDETCASQK
jgi:hypothetical protein